MKGGGNPAEALCGKQDAKQVTSVTDLKDHGVLVTEDFRQGRIILRLHEKSDVLEIGDHVVAAEA